MNLTVQELNRLLRQGNGSRIPPLVCKSGLSLSVQAGEGLYSEPRHMAGSWTAVEVGFPSRRVMALAPYREAGGKLTETVYPYVPIGLVVRIVNRNGGLVA
jgi:hypothetical protein